MSTLSKNSEDLSCDSCCYIGVRKQSSWVSHSHWITVLSIKHETIDQYLAGEKNLMKKYCLSTENDPFENLAKMPLKSVYF